MNYTFEHAVAWIEHVSQDTRLRYAAKAVALQLYAEARKARTMHVEMSNAQLCAALGMSKPTLLLHLDSLEVAGWILRQYQPGLCTVIALRRQPVGRREIIEGQSDAA